ISLGISSPPIKFPCFNGVDTGVKKDLIASQMTIPEICKHIGADSLQYLSYDGLIKSCGGNQEDFCTACLNGDYPIPVIENGTLPGKAEWEDGRQGV
ncbi:MAG: amidophosphoribosyltransferase, partial [Caldisericia bacterium]|nr:amidophosphoribosyltransferase [Caldisericia bacterium]